MTISNRPNLSDMTSSLASGTLFPVAARRGVIASTHCLPTTLPTRVKRTDLSIKVYLSITPRDGSYLAKRIFFFFRGSCQSSVPRLRHYLVLLRKFHIPYLLLAPVMTANRDRRELGRTYMIFGRAFRASLQTFSTSTTSLFFL